MDKIVKIDEKALKRLPPIFILIFIILLGFPVLALTYFGADFSTMAKDMTINNNLGFVVIESQIRSYFKQVLLQWSGFSLSVITVLFALTKYRLTKDKIALLIGLTILFSGSVQALHTLVIDGLFLISMDKENLDAIIWTFTNTVSGLIFAIGLLILLYQSQRKVFHLSKFIVIGLLFGLTTLVFFIYMLLVIGHPVALFKNDFIPRPYELIDITIYVSIIFFIYPEAYKKYPTILTNCIFYMSITQVVIALYLMFLPSTLYDNAYNIAYYLKIIVYFIPFSCFIINYIYSYNSILEAQKEIDEGQKKLEYFASHDPLTDLYNRREFEQLLDKTIANASRERQSFALFLLDIDNFKSINDTLGHTYGDHFLQKFSEKLVLLTRKGDILSRLGGDEFTIITSPLKSLSSARKLAERMITSLNTSYHVDEKWLSSTVSIGIAIYPMDGENTKELLKHADIAMYNAKRSGKNSHHFYTKNLSDEQDRESEIESHLREALKKDELALYYQPQYNLVTKEIIGAEVLLRWKSEKLGPLSPDEFIPIAEHSNLIINIGNWVLNKACEQAKHWFDTYHRHLYFSINVSPLQFENNNFYLHFKDTLKRFDYPPQYLNIEITENLLMKNTDEVNQGLGNINLLGANILLDDFGMGYSSLSRLQSLPISALKIDKSFVAGIQNETDSVFVIDTIIKLGRELETIIIAEGIENEAQLNYLVARKCYLGQGFLFNKAIPAEVFEKLAYEQSS